MNAQEFLKQKRIVTTVNGKDSEIEVGKGLVDLLEEYHQHKLNENIVLGEANYCGCDWENRDLDKTAHLTCNECKKPL